MKTIPLILFPLLFLLAIACEKGKNYPDKIQIGNASANEFIYYDVNPDAILQTRDVISYKIDINHDQVDDFKLTLFKIYILAGNVLNYESITISTLHDNAFVFSDSSLNANVLSEGDIVKNSENFRNGEFLLYSLQCSLLPPFGDCSSAGKWDYIDDKYIGVRLKNDRLGWIKIGVTYDFSLSLRVYDYGIIKD